MVAQLRFRINLRLDLIAGHPGMASKRRNRGSLTTLGVGVLPPSARPLQRSQSSISSWQNWSETSLATPRGRLLSEQLPFTPSSQRGVRLVKPASEYPENFRKIIENFQRNVARDCQQKPRSLSTSIPNNLNNKGAFCVEQSENLSL